MKHGVYDRPRSITGLVWRLLGHRRRRVLAAGAGAMGLLGVSIVIGALRGPPSIGTRYEARGIWLAPALVFNGQGYAVLRSHSDGTGSHLFLDRFDARGNPLGRSEELNGLHCPVRNAALAWSGRRYGVAWACGTDQTGGHPMFFRVVSAEGTSVVDAVALTPTSDHTDFAQLAWDGRAFGAAWYGETQRALVFARVDETGALVTPARIVARDARVLGRPAVAFSGRRYGVSWVVDWAQRRGATVSFAAVGPEGDAHGTPSAVYADSTASGRPLAAWDGARFGLLWQEYDRSRIVFAAGDERGVEVAPRTVINGDRYIFASDAAWTGDHWGIAWTTGSGLWFQRADREGHAEGAPVHLGTRTVDAMRVVWSGSEYAVVWQWDLRRDALTLTRVSAAGERVGDDIALSAPSRD